MPKNTKLLKKHCNVEYKLFNENKVVGNLSDTQLEKAKKQLINKKQLTPLQEQQLSAIEYLQSHRSNRNIKILIKNTQKERSKDKEYSEKNKTAIIIANKTATNIIKYLKRTSSLFK